MPIDHLFSLLEDEFERQDIERVINDELSIKDSDRDNLESHQIILKLATTSYRLSQSPVMIIRGYYFHRYLNNHVNEQCHLSFLLY
jgi:hypothetical protein